MQIRGERGPAGVGFSLKDVNANGVLYCYVWDKRTYDSQTGKIKGWTSIGRYPEQETLEKLEHHLRTVYGDKFTLDEVEAELDRQEQKLERKRNENLTRLHEEIETLYLELGITDYELPKTIKNTKAILQKLKEQVA